MAGKWGHRFFKCQNCGSEPFAQPSTEERYPGTQQPEETQVPACPLCSHHPEVAQPRLEEGRFKGEQGCAPGQGQHSGMIYEMFREQTFNKAS